MTKEKLLEIWQWADHIFKQSRLPDVRRNARKIAMYIERDIPNFDLRSAEHWEI
jgi:hypothetical protein